MEPDPLKYEELLLNIKNRIDQTRDPAVNNYKNAEVIFMHYDIGKLIYAFQKAYKGTNLSLLQKLSKDLRLLFPEMRSLQFRSLDFMRRFAKDYENNMPFIRDFATRVPWSTHTHLIHKVFDIETRIFYIKEAAEHCWSRTDVIQKIDSGYHHNLMDVSLDIQEVEKNNITSKNILAKSSFVFDFLSLDNNASERQLEDGLILHIGQFLAQLGPHFSYIGRQRHLRIGGQNFFLDLLFYHTQLHSYVIIELKEGNFLPEHVGKLNLYVSVVDAQLKGPNDRPTQGILLCKESNSIVAEHTLQRLQDRISVANYSLQPSTELLEDTAGSASDDI